MATEALRIALQHMEIEELVSLREENEVLKSVLDRLIDQLEWDYRKHYILVEYAHRSDENPKKWATERALEEFGEECRALAGSNSSWVHGFHCAMAASTKMYLDMAYYKAETVQEFFPELIAEEDCGESLKDKDQLEYISFEAINNFPEFP